jgi:hypothetical protein
MWVGDWSHGPHGRASGYPGVAAFKTHCQPGRNGGLRGSRDRRFAPLLDLADAMKCCCTTQAGLRFRGDADGVLTSDITVVRPSGLALRDSPAEKRPGDHLSDTGGSSCGPTQTITFDEAAVNSGGARCARERERRWDALPGFRQLVPDHERRAGTTVEPGQALGRMAVCFRYKPMSRRRGQASRSHPGDVSLLVRVTTRSIRGGPLDRWANSMHRSR